ncbi:MAG: hypothetical protein VXB67_15550 [Deltaproteobacteria bacterium]
MFKILGFLLICCSFLLLACSEADTLGDEPPTEIVIEGTPTWRNGIGELVELKCASCHQVPASSYTPGGTPATLDLRHYDTAGSVQGGDKLGIWIKAGILEKQLGGIRKMPLEYATPLTEREITYLKDWASSGSPE